jgi:hypothetical protein
VAIELGPGFARVSDICSSGSPCTIISMLSIKEVTEPRKLDDTAVVLLRNPGMKLAAFGSDEGTTCDVSPSPVEVDESLDSCAVEPFVVAERDAVVAAARVPAGMGLF